MQYWLSETTALRGIKDLYYLKYDKKSKPEAEDDADEGLPYETKVKRVAVIAKPLADEKLCKKVLKLCKKASKRKQIRCAQPHGRWLTLDLFAATQQGGPAAALGGVDGAAAEGFVSQARREGGGQSTPKERQGVSWVLLLRGSLDARAVDG